jgi:hypothetical protein
MRWADNIERVREMRIMLNILVGKPGEKEQIGRPRRRWEDIRMVFRETGLEVVDWIHLAHDRYQWWTVMKTAKTSDAIKSSKFLEQPNDF